MTINRFLTVIIIICCCTSCKDKARTTIIGLWTIDSIIYKQNEIRTCLSNNLIVFYKNGKVDLPVPEDYCSEMITEYNTNGRWEVKYKQSFPISLNITTKNKIFKGTYHVIFIDDKENNLLKMIIKSDSVYVVCRKALFNYDGEHDLINYLEEESKSGGDKK